MHAARKRPTRVRGTTARTSQPTPNGTRTRRKADAQRGSARHRPPHLEELQSLRLNTLLAWFLAQKNDFDFVDFLSEEFSMLRAEAVFGGSVTHGDRVLLFAAGLSGMMTHMLRTRTDPPPALVKAVNAYCSEAGLVWDALPGGSTRAAAKDDLIRCATELMSRDHRAATPEQHEAWVTSWVERAVSCACPRAWLVEAAALYRRVLKNNKARHAKEAGAREKKNDGRALRKLLESQAREDLAVDLLWHLFGVHAPWLVASPDMNDLATKLTIELEVSDKRAKGRAEEAGARGIVAAFLRTCGVATPMIDQAWAYIRVRAGRAPD